MKNLHTEIYNAALNFQNKINNLREQDNLSDAVIDCNSSFSRLESFVNLTKEMTNQNEGNFVELKKQNEFTYKQYTKNTFVCTIIIHDKFGILSVDTNNYVLNELLYKILTLENICDILNMYYDYEDRSCDICGLYKENGADLRQWEENYIAAYHSECVNKTQL